MGIVLQIAITMNHVIYIFSSFHRCKFVSFRISCPLIIRKIFEIKLHNFNPHSQENSATTSLKFRLFQPTLIIEKVKKITAREYMEKQKFNIHVLHKIWKTNIQLLPEWNVIQAKYNLNVTSREDGIVWIIKWAWWGN